MAKTVRIWDEFHNKPIGRMRTDREPEYPGPTGEYGTGLIHHSLHRIKQRSRDRTLWVHRFYSLWDNGRGVNAGETAMALSLDDAAAVLEDWGYEIPDELMKEA